MAAERRRGCKADGVIVEDFGGRVLAARALRAGIDVMAA